MRASGFMTRWTGMGYALGRIIVDIKGSITMDLSKDMENMCGS